MVNRRYGGDAAGAGELPPVDVGTTIGPCPSCGAEISIGMAPDPHSGGKPTKTLMHPMPFCHYFGATSPEEIERAILSSEVVS